MQGFCCACGTNPDGDKRIGWNFDDYSQDGSNKPGEAERTRTGVLCDWKNQPGISHFAQVPRSAHCLRPTANPNGRFQWSMEGAYELNWVNQTKIVFALVVTVDTTLATDLAATDAVSVVSISDGYTRYHPSPDWPSMHGGPIISAPQSSVSADLPVSVEIHNYETSDFWPQFSNSILIVEQAAYQLHLLDKDEIFIVPEIMVSKDGGDCNRVGTFFPAFKCDPLQPTHPICSFKHCRTSSAQFSYCWYLSRNTLPSAA